MRRLLALLLIPPLLVLGGCGGSSYGSLEETPVSFYYLSHGVEELSGGDTVTAEVRYPGDLTLWEFFDSYFAGPESEALISPFPPGTRVVDVQGSDGNLTLKLSGEFFTLMGVEMTLACCCLSNTVCSYMDIESVALTDETESIRMELQPEQYLLSNELQESHSESFLVYFSDSERRYLVAETRAATLSENETAEAYVMRKLLEGPENEQLLAVIPAGTRILSVRTEGSVCTVDLSHEFYDNRLDEGYGAYMTIYGIVNTLTSLEGIQSVAFLREGETVPDYGIFPLDQPVGRNAGCIGPVRTASSEVDISLFVLSEEDKTPFAFPCRVKQTISQPLAQAVTAQVLSYEPPQGFYNPIPFGTELLNISVSGSVCYVDVSAKFIPQEDTRDAEREAVWALVAALTDLDNISSVVLTIEGESGGLGYVDISEPLTKQSVSLD